MISPLRYLRSAALVVMALGLGACADSPTAPSLDAAASPLASLSVGGASVTTFVYSPQFGVTQHLGQHKIVMPGGSVCDLTSSYGVSEWDQPCAPAQRAILITATTWVNADGHPQVDFQPSMRFVPTSDSRQFVKLFIRDKDADDAELAAKLRIDWVPFLGAPAVNEAATDPTLRTMIANGIAWRRIKHFSGYMVASGRTAFAEDSFSDGAF